MEAQKIIDTVLEDDMAKGTGDVECPFGYWAYSEVGGTVYGVVTDTYGNKNVLEFEDWEDAEDHAGDIDAATIRWFLGDAEDAEDADFVYDDVED